MSTSPFDYLLAEMDRTNSTIRRAKAGLLDAYDYYGVHGPPLRESVEAAMAPYLDGNRDTQIQEAAEQVTLDIRRFTGDCASILSAVAVLGMSFVSAVEMMKISANPASRFWPDSPGDRAADAVGDFLKQLDEHQLQMTVTAARAVELGRHYEKALRVATSFPTIRQAHLQEYLGRTASADLDAVMDSALGVLKTEGRDLIVEETLKYAVEHGLQMALESVVPLARLATIALDIRNDFEKMRALKNSRQRNDVDELMLLARRLKLARTTTENNILWFTELTKAMQES
jgi:hypothetical protein